MLQTLAGRPGQATSIDGSSAGVAGGVTRARVSELSPNPPIVLQKEYQPNVQGAL